MRIHRLLAASLVALIVSVLGSITPQPAVAASDSPITIALTTTVDEVYDYANVLGGTFHPGDTITGTYIYNAAANNISSHLNEGRDGLAGVRSSESAERWPGGRAISARPTLARQHSL